jgi:diadenosine tetraphosphatase ApaH/serine/threonine PP2A family protein phosphatase
MRHIIIGDVHGCIFELESLLERVHLSHEDVLYFIGDLISKGPNSVAVVKKAFSLSQHFRVVLILGNHEEKFLRYLKNKQLSEKVVMSMQNTEEFKILAAQLSDDEINFLQNSYLYFSIPDTKYLLVHGGILPNSQMDRPATKLSEFSGKILGKMRLLTMTRMISKEGKFLGLNETEEGMYFWADKYDGRYGKIVFGHQPFVGKDVKYFPNAIGIDTGCVFGGTLSAVIIEKESIIQLCVAAHKVYCHG